MCSCWLHMTAQAPNVFVRADATDLLPETAAFVRRQVSQLVCTHPARHGQHTLFTMLTRSRTKVASAAWASMRGDSLARRSRRRLSYSSLLASSKATSACATVNFCSEEAFSAPLAWLPLLLALPLEVLLSSEPAIVHEVTAGKAR